MSDRNSNVNIHSDNNTNNIGATIYNFGEIPTVIKCEKCNKIFATSQTLKTHLMTINCVKETNMSNKCMFCDKEFSSKQMLAYHNNVCTNKKISLIATEYENKIKQLEEELRMLKIQKEV